MEMSESSQWCTIESDPGVFTSLIEDFGVKDVEVTELWSMDPSSLETLVAQFESVYGLIFLFKWESEASTSLEMNEDGMNKRRRLMEGDEAPSDLFFARQVIHNACATQAILGVLFNGPAAVNLGETLGNLKNFMMPLPPNIKGETIGASDTLRTVHNSFARRDMFDLEKEKKRTGGSTEDVFHFIAYVPHSNGHVFEIDGLSPGPVSVGTFHPNTDIITSPDLAWLDVARIAIQDRIDKYSMGEIKFNLMAICKDRRLGIHSRMNNLISAGLTDGDEMLEELQVQLMEEDAKRQSWKEENERRRHNYIPLFLEILKEYAKSGKLPELTRLAKKKLSDRKIKEKL